MRQGSKTNVEITRLAKGEDLNDPIPLEFIEMGSFNKQ